MNDNDKSDYIWDMIILVISIIIIWWIYVSQ